MSDDEAEKHENISKFSALAYDNESDTENDEEETSDVHHKNTGEEYLRKSGADLTIMSDDNGEYGTQENIKIDDSLKFAEKKQPAQLVWFSFVHTIFSKIS